MKKTAIVSCYFIHNYGSMLQAYATQKVLDKLNVENETVNVTGFLKDLRRSQYLYILKSGITSDIFRTRLGKAKNLLEKRFLSNEYTKSIKYRDLKFDEFKQKYIRLSEEYSSIDSLSKKCEEKYEAVLIGSDQLWLPANIAANYYTLNFVPESVNSIAYATSFGVSSLPRDTAEMVRKFMPRIKHVSVREQSGQALIEQITGRKVPVVCDPTLLLTGDEWLEVQEQSSVEREPYIFCYFIGKTTVHREFVKRLRMETKLKVVALTHVDHYVKCDEGYADVTPYNVGPMDFVRLIKNATHICTDSFHCSVFSILYSKNFYVFRRYTQLTKQSTNSRLDTLFDLLNIKGRILNGDEDINACLCMYIDYEKVHGLLDALREYSYSYLKKALWNNSNLM
ncbi:polysaccharide pyruvyl transferase family protein [Bacteroides cellulosilyticus]|uniref:polysaccharide pyruvyl transferase family protein n=1 Tax=Bacteroides cellulosilyticus TaxID=246787 RepID=UPI0032EAF6F8